jgi:site-specific recombinase XerD
VLETGVITAYLDWLALRGLAQTTISTRRNVIARLATVLPCPLTEATPAQLLAWRSALDLTPDVIAHYVAYVRQFYAWTLAGDLTGTNPADSLPAPRTGRRLPRPVSEADLIRALDSAPKRIRLWLVLAAWCGLRAKEIALLRRENILDTADPPVLIIAADATKGARERTVPLSAFALREITAAGLPLSGWAFRRCDGQSGPNAPWMVSQLCNEHLHDEGIAATLHMCRHRFGTQAWRARHDLRVVQEMMGHADPATTAGYCAFDQPDAVAAVEGIPAPRRLRPVRLRGFGNE